MGFKQDYTNFKLIKSKKYLRYWFNKLRFICLCVVWKTEQMQITSLEFSLPPWLRIQWENVGRLEKKSSGVGIYLPEENFNKDPSQYLKNKFLDIGLYPRFLWLFKEYLPELREHFIFHDHLQSNVRSVNWYMYIVKNKSQRHRGCNFCKL